MVKESNELLIEVWSRIKEYVPPKERVDAAEAVVMAFDDFGCIDEDIYDFDLDRELKAAIKSRISNPADLEEEEGFDDDDYRF